MQRVLRPVATLAVVLVLFALLPATTGAHESLDVAGGQFRMVVGFLNEPVAVGDKSGLDLRVTKLDPTATQATGGGETDQPVEGLETTLQAEVFFGDQAMTLALEPRFGQPGAYASYFYPNAVGDYTFQIFGTIDGVTIDETFTSGPDTFGPVEERLLFPPDPAAAGEAADTAGAGTLVIDGNGRDGALPVAVIAGGLLALAAGWWARRARAGRLLATAPLGRR